jgi:hypothetical protein
VADVGFKNIPEGPSSVIIPRDSLAVGISTMGAGADFESYMTCEPAKLPDALSKQSAAATPKNFGLRGLPSQKGKGIGASS